jgi:hypothetical protein
LTDNKIIHHINIIKSYIIFTGTKAHTYITLKLCIYLLKMIFQHWKNFFFLETNNLLLEILANIIKYFYIPKLHQTGTNQSIFCVQYSFHSIVLRALFWLPYLRYRFRHKLDCNLNRCRNPCQLWFST